MHNIVTTICEIIICIEMVIDILKMTINYPYVLEKKVLKKAILTYKNLPSERQNEFKNEYQKLKHDLRQNKDIQSKHIVRFQNAKRGLFINALTNILLLVIWIV